MVMDPGLLWPGIRRFWEAEPKPRLTVCRVPSRRRLTPHQRRQALRQARKDRREARQHAARMDHWSDLFAVHHRDYGHGLRPQEGPEPGRDPDGSFYALGFKLTPNPPGAARTGSGE